MHVFLASQNTRTSLLCAQILRVIPPRSWFQSSQHQNARSKHRYFPIFQESQLQIASHGEAGRATALLGLDFIQATVETLYLFPDHFRTCCSVWDCTRRHFEFITAPRKRNESSRKAMHMKLASCV